MKLVTFDLATVTGWTDYDSDTGELKSGAKSFRADRDQPEGARWFNAYRFMSPMVVEADCVGYERIDFTHKSTMAARCYFSLESQLSRACFAHKTPLLPFSPSDVKKMALHRGAGKGTDKEAMLDAAKHQWPDRHIVDHNEADALWILACLMRFKGLAFQHFDELAV
ncbi:hypothetical protein MLD52_09030 [Puniceicoccaceae bacterium K14]|nr:hypothetical protein [Puniceicoccaceae bacterium K14]